MQKAYETFSISNPRYMENYSHGFIFPPPDDSSNPKGNYSG